MPRGGRRTGAGRPPAGGEVRALIQEAAGILAADMATLHRIARGGLDHAQTPEALDAVARAVASDGMMASRRIHAAARALRRVRNGLPPPM